jgi:pyruvate/2-oxoglutarate dehydrogenase complex dihydrolipoamide acyltransferase (E2) component
MEDINQSAGERQTDTIQKLDYADRWIGDSIAATPHPGFFVLMEIDMTSCNDIIQQFRDKQVKVTYTHIFIRAVALVLSKHPDLHQLIKGTRRLLPRNVDIGLSVQGDSVTAPVMVIENAESKTLQEIAREVVNRAPEIRSEDKKRLRYYRRWGRVVPFGFLRQWMSHIALNQLGFVRKHVGTFQVTTLRQVDIIVPLSIVAGAVLGVGGVRDRVLVINGKQEIRPTAFISCSVDHKLWDGARAAKFMTALNDFLQSDELKFDY